MTIIARRLAVLLALGLSLSVAAQEAQLSGISQPGGMQVSLRSQLVPLTINQMHGWVITVLDPDGNPVTDAEIEGEGGMPLHNHGLPTRPQVTRNLGDGDYLLEGVRFNMPGQWEFRLVIAAGEVRDTIRFELDV